MDLNHLPEPVNLQCLCSACDLSGCLVKQNIDGWTAEMCLILNKVNKNEEENSQETKLETNNSFVKEHANELKENKYIKNIMEMLSQDYYNDNSLNETENFQNDLSNSHSNLNSPPVKLNLQTEDDPYKESENHEDETDNFENTVLRNSFGKLNPSIAKLSAQIMNVPYREFKNPISNYNIEPETLYNTNIPKEPSFDLFKKIKDVYKACSCKICECIAGKSFQNGLCNCKPCDCEDCKTFLKQKTISGHAIELFQTGVICPIFEKDSRRKVIKSKLNQECKCKPCECVQCVESMAMQCACKPCECIQCRPHKVGEYQKLIVAAVGHNNVQLQNCQCSPCQCLECAQNFGITSNSIHHEMSTGVNRHLQCNCENCQDEACLPDTNETCSCERRDKVMRKPVQKHNTDYDIRRALITRNVKHADKDKNDMIAMFAAVTNGYSNYYRQGKACSCTPCECLYCNQNDISVDGSNRLNYDYILHDDKLNTKDAMLKPCDCGKCDCLKCEKLSASLNIYKKTKAISKFSSKGTKCMCNPCECINCDRSMGSCTGDICNCVDCKCEYCSFDKDIHPLKKGKPLTPVIYKNNLYRSFTTFLNKAEDNDNEISTKNSGLLIETNKNILEDRCQNNSQTSQSKLKPKFCEQINKHYERELSVQITDVSKQAANSFQTTASNESRSSSISSFNYTKSCLQSEGISQIRLSKNLGHDNFDYLIKPPKNLGDVMEPDFKNELRNVPSQKCAFDKHLSISTKSRIVNANNVHKNDRFKINKQNRDKLCYGGCSLVHLINFMPEQIDISNQCDIKRQEHLCSTAENHNECWVKISSNNSKQSHNFSNCSENTYNGENKYIAEKYQDLTSSTTPKHFNRDHYDYKSFQETLKEAQEFSLFLGEMLGRYEKANRELESIANKLKQFNVTHSGKYEMSNAQKFLHSSKKIWMSESSIMRNAEKDFDVTLHTTDKNTKYGSLSFLNIETDDVYINTKTVQFSKHVECAKNEINNDCEAILQIKQSSENSTLGSSESDNFEMSSTDNFEHCKSNLKPIVEEKESSTGQINLSIKYQTLKKTNMRRYNKINKRTVIPTKPTKKGKPKTLNCSIRAETTKDFLNVLDGYDNIPTMHKTLSLGANKQVILRPDNTAMGDVSSAALLRAYEIRKPEETSNCLNHNFLADKSMVMIKPPTDTELMKWADEKPRQCPILKKNFSSTIDCNHPRLKIDSDKSYETSRETENVIKEASTSWQSNHDFDTRTAQIENKSLTHGCDNLKVNFIHTEQISEHSVMVKWNAPKILKNVQGYELLVDGRTVEKIFNVSCRMALLRCLPVSDRILVTVRTVTTLPCAPSFWPSTTVVYRPYHKKLV